MYFELKFSIFPELFNRVDHLSEIGLLSGSHRYLLDLFLIIRHVDSNELAEVEVSFSQVDLRLA